MNTMTDFDLYHFLRYLKLGFHGYEGLTIQFLIENMIDWIEVNSDVELIKFLDDIMPQVHHGEILMFAPDCWLNEEDLKIKRDNLETHAAILQEVMQY